MSGSVVTWELTAGNLRQGAEFSLAALSSHRAIRRDLEMHCKGLEREEGPLPSCQWSVYARGELWDVGVR